MTAQCRHDYPELPGCVCCSSPDCDLDPDAIIQPCDHVTVACPNRCCDACLFCHCGGPPVQCEAVEARAIRFPSSSIYSANH